MPRRPLQVLCAAGVAACSLVGCASSSGHATPATTVPSTTAPTTTSTSTTVAPTTTLPAKATVGSPSGYDAAIALVTAWQNHDRVAASKVADAEAVKGMFANTDPVTGNRGCSTDPTLPEGGCIFRTEHGGITISTEKRAIGWVVTYADYAPIAPLG